MLFETEIEIRITNDGVDNKTEIRVPKTNTIIEALTAMEMAKKSLEQLFISYVKSLPSEPSKKQLKIITQNTQMKNLLNY